MKIFYLNQIVIFKAKKLKIPKKLKLHTYRKFFTNFVIIFHDKCIIMHLHDIFKNIYDCLS